jgi:methyl-accepting chemotaxis protein
MQSMSVKQMFVAVLALVIALLALMGIGIGRYEAASAAVAKANLARYNSYLLADELRQSSDDLTRLARTYVVSGDPKWEAQYFEILDIRNGKKPRPNEYEKIYWDFRAADIDPGKGVGATLALTDLMKQAGFTDAEFDKLKEAAGNSDDLVKTETVAMNMVKGLYADESGRFTKKAEPDFAKAREMMHDRNYHLYKAKIMKPVDAFLTLLDKRTQADIVAAESVKETWHYLLIGTAMLMLVLLSLSFHLVYRRIALALQRVVDISNVMATGDLRGALQDQGPHEVAVMMRSLSIMRDSFVRVVSTVRQGSEGVNTASTEIAQGNLDLSARTESQASALEETASSMDKLNAQVTHNAQTASAASQLASSAATVAVRGGEVVGRVVETMKEINNSSKKIADIISVIDGIAFQTNILALNAAVEAARAGEHGRGFAVVASEVRSLAGRSADAAKEIKSLINDSVERVGQGTALVDEAGSTMNEVVSSIKKVSDLVGEISAASNAQATGVAQVGQAIAQIDQVTQQNAALVEQIAAAAGSLRTQSGELVQTVALFQLGGHSPSFTPLLGSR